MRNTAPRERAPFWNAKAEESSTRHMSGRLRPAPRGMDEKDVSTTQSPTQTHARLPGAHGNTRWPTGSKTPPRQGTQAPHGQHSTQTAPLRATADQRLPKSRRVRKRPEFLRLQRVGRRYVGPNFIVITEQRPSGISRIGITASRHVGGAVVRNRVKRLVREFFRRHYQQLVPPRSVVVIARPSAAGTSYAEVSRELGAALKITRG